jgi:heme/copper-type cytochrome/quinol oxidase subunit 2
MKNQSRRARRLARQQQKRNRKVAFLLIVTAVLGLTGYLLVSAFSRPALEPVAGNVVDIAADMAGFDRREIRVKAGEAVTIRLTSLDNQFHTDGGGKHQWAVDELDVSVIAPPEGSNTVVFTPEQPGTYTFYCDICCGGRANPSMQGTLVVEA